MFRTFLHGAIATLLARAVMAEDLSQIEWETNMDDPPIGAPDQAIRGGTFQSSITAYPLTFRLIGPNSNDAFAGWNRTYAMDFGLVNRHPTTRNFIPWMATHWSIQPDNKTVYYKLDPDARWSDGEPITADDYVFAFNFLQRTDIVAPFYNSRMEEYYEDVSKIDEHTLKIVGKFESWRPLTDFGLFALPEHDIAPGGLESFDGAAWITDHNNKPAVVQGPYTVGDRQPGQYVEFDRMDDWWGDEKHYMQGMFNPDHIRLIVVADRDRAFDFFKKGELSFYTVTTARIWAEEMEFPAIKKGWAHRKRIFLDTPQGLYGLAMNLEKPIFQNKDFRKALQYMFDFHEINDKLMHGAYYRAVSCFEGTEFANHDLRPYPFDPRKGREHLVAAGYTKRGNDGIFVHEDGHRASFTLTYGSKGLERHLTVVKQRYGRFGVEVKLELLEPGAAFAKGLERSYEACIMNRTAGYYPGPHQYFSSYYLDKQNNNNIWAFGDEHVDELIDIYRFGMDEQARIDAMHEIDAIIQDEAFYIPWWYGPFIRFTYWDYMEFPDFYFPALTEQFMDYQVWWVNEEKRARLDDAMANDRSLGEDTEVDLDPYGVKERLEAMMAASNSQG